jgi:rhodanese-related sulfurtransferase
MDPVAKDRMCAQGARQVNHSEGDDLMKTSAATMLSAVFLIATCMVSTNRAMADEEHVYITHDLPYAEVENSGKTVRIERNPDPLNLIDADYSLTSRPCPPYCIQPMTLAPGVETIGELEVINYLRAIRAGNQDLMVVDSRTDDWTKRTGIIPGAVIIPWDRLFRSKNDVEKIAELLEDTFKAHRDGPLWDFSQAKTLIFYCNGAWCGQSPTNIKTLLSLGYPASKLKWYRGGMQDWKSLGLTTVEP